MSIHIHPDIVQRDGHVGPVTGGRGSNAAKNKQSRKIPAFLNKQDRPGGPGHSAPPAGAGHRDAAAFNQPVDAKALQIPDYHTIILRPMDLGTVAVRRAPSAFCLPGGGGIWEHFLFSLKPASDPPLTDLRRFFVFLAGWGLARTEWLGALGHGAFLPGMVANEPPPPRPATQTIDAGWFCNVQRPSLHRLFTRRGGRATVPPFPWQKRLDNYHQHYTMAQDLAEDVRLIWHNCKLVG